MGNITGNLEKSRWKYPILGLFMMLVLGIIYAWSIFVKPLEDEFGWVRSQTSMTFTVMLVAFCLGQFFGGQLGDRLGARKVMGFAGIMLGLGFLLASFTSTLPWLYIFYGACCGFPIGLCMNNNVNTCIRWFPDHVGFINGFVIMGYGLSSMILGPLVNWIILVWGWRWAMRVLAILAFIMVFGFAQMYKFPPKGWVPSGFEAIKNDAIKIGQGKGLSSKQMLTKGTFWCIFIWFVIIHTGCFMLSAGLSAHVQSYGVDATAGALVVGVFGVLNGLGRPGFGLISDKIPSKKVMMIADSVTLLIGFLCLAFLPGIINPVAATIIGCLFAGFAFGGSVSIVIGSIREYFGSKFNGSNIGILALGDGPAGLIGPMLGAKIFMSTGSYTIAFVIAAGICVIGIILPLFIKKQDFDKAAIDRGEVVEMGEVEAKAAV